jgi:hypothetical protein
MRAFIGRKLIELGQRIYPNFFAKTGNIIWKHEKVI